MSDLREVVALVLVRICGTDTERVADAVLAAIRKDHAIVKRVGEDVVEAAAQACISAYRAASTRDLIRTGAPALRQTIGVAVPVITAHARDATLEEADAWLRAKAEAVAGDDPANITAKTMGRVIVGFADEMRDALLPTPPQPDPVAVAREAVVEAALDRHNFQGGALDACDAVERKLDNACAALVALESRS